MPISNVLEYKYKVSKSYFVRPPTADSQKRRTGGAPGTRSPPGRRKKLGPNLQGKVVSVPPGRATVTFLLWSFWWEGEIWRVGMVNLSVLAYVLWGRLLNKGRKVFGEKSAPLDKILAAPLTDVTVDQKWGTLLLCSFVPSSAVLPNRNRTTLANTPNMHL